MLQTRISAMESYYWLQTAMYLLCFELLCASHAEVTVPVLMHSTSEALPLILSSYHLENPGCMFGECLNFAFLDREQGEDSHQSIHSVPLHVAVPPRSWEVAANEPVPSSIPPGCCTEEKPTHRLDGCDIQLHDVLLLEKGMGNVWGAYLHPRKAAVKKRCCYKPKTCYYMGCYEDD